tara:strand:+ start:8118 stop:10001 length:1884 start_codon:yes stop_codon:yes gene_type:complete
MAIEVNNHARISKLDSIVANQIAAGEVIERPANVIKELVENSLDAKANNIRIEVKNYGIDLICIKDDGVGIHKNDLPLAMSEHATSKISKINDLNSLSSFGFRGEALSSIASVSNFKLISKNINSDKAYEISNELQIYAASHNQGTSLIIENLFYNTPARKRFLKSEKTENQHILDIVNRIILSNFSVGFTFINNSKQIYRFNKADIQDIKDQRIKKILGSQFLNNSKYFESFDGDIKLSGWIGNTDINYSNSDKQYVFLNNRIVKDKLLSSAIKSIYQDKIPKGRYPSFVIFIDIDPKLVDVNVHPSKYEVRFQNSYYIYSIIRQKLITVLDECDQKDNIISSSIIENNLINHNIKEKNSRADLFKNISENQSNNNKYNYSVLDKLNTSHSSFKANKSNKSYNLFEIENKHVEKSLLSNHEESYFGEIIEQIDNKFLLTKNSDNKLFILNISNAYAYYVYLQIMNKINLNQKLSNFNLIVFPKVIISNKLILKFENQNVKDALDNLGFEFEIYNNVFILKKIPDELKYADIDILLDILYKFLENHIVDASIFKQDIIHNFVFKLASIAFGRLCNNYSITEQTKMITSLGDKVIKNKDVKSINKFKFYSELNASILMQINLLAHDDV